VSAKGANIVPAKGRIEWPYVTLLVAIVLMIAAAAHLLSAWNAFVIFAVLLGLVGRRAATNSCFLI
jgi:hypothetical protein